MLAFVCILMAITFLGAASIVLFFSYAVTIDGRPMSWLLQAGASLWFVLIAAGLIAIGVTLWRLSGKPPATT